MDKKNFYIVDSDVLPEVFSKVVAAKDLLDSGVAQNVTEAVSLAGLSRSAFYKYRDCVFKLKENDSTKLNIQAVLADRAGVFSAMSGELCKNGANIITMNQTEPKDGAAAVTLTIGIDRLGIPIDELIKAVEKIDGVLSIKAI